jgi:peptide chain release factor subunit 3
MDPNVPEFIPSWLPQAKMMPGTPARSESPAEPAAADASETEAPMEPSSATPPQLPADVDSEADVEPPDTWDDEDEDGQAPLKGLEMLSLNADNPSREDPSAASSGTAKASPAAAAAPAKKSSSSMPPPGDGGPSSSAATKRPELTGPTVGADAKKPLSVVLLGHVDAGKSTISGNILVLTGNVDERTMEKYEKEAKALNRESWKFAFALDSSEQERAKGKTEEYGQAAFTTDTRRFTILDAPGHKVRQGTMRVVACQTGRSFGGG